jgi:D-alanyl-D-alanine carboxypeptidase
MESKKRKLKFNIRNVGVLAIFVIAIILICMGAIALYNNSTYKKLRDLNYTKEAAKLIIKNKLDDYILKNNTYSKTLDVALVSGEYEKDNLDLYVDLQYKNYDKYIYYLNELKKLGYMNDEINIILSHLKSSDVSIVVNKKSLITNLASYVIDDYFKIDNLDRYTNYKTKHNDYSYEKVINYVNMNLDYDFYTHGTSVKNPDDTLVLVNKYRILSEDYVPKNLVSLSSDYAADGSYKVVDVVKEAFEGMCADMKSIGLTVKAVSAYRNYDTQKDLYDNYVKRDGVKVADTYSARPGYSEHQTGLALDVYNGTIAYTSFDQTNEYKWLKDNAHRYGFIIRYQKDKESITGYKYEPWHLRYVGEEVATYIYSKNITFDEYYTKFIAK